MPRILVTDGNQRSTLAVTRSLGVKGLDVVVGEDTIPCLASSSKYCVKAIRYRSPLADPQGFVDDVLHELRTEKYDMFIPMTDLTTYLVINNIDKFKPLTRLPLPPTDEYFKAIDKGELIKLSQNLGVPVPKTYFISGSDDLDSIAKDITFPIVIKPRHSKYLTSTGWRHLGVGYASNMNELKAIIEGWDKATPLPILQERISGNGEGAFFLFDKGEPKAYFFHRRIREKPPSGGVSVLRESIPVDPQMKEYGIQLLKSLNWHGVAMVEFKLDDRDNIPRVMEINARLWGSLQLAIDSGVDFPFLLYRMAMGEDVPPLYDYTTGVKLRWLMGDIDHLQMRLLKSNKRLNLPSNYAGRPATMFEFMKFYQAKMKYEILRSDDIKPFVFEFGQWLKDLFR
jgi:predicted ATP-grasp superfamily ATP-dependent carboligase